MKRPVVTIRIVGWLAILASFLMAGAALAQQAAPGPDYQKQAQDAIANCEGTRKIVVDSIKKVEAKASAAGASDMLKKEVGDAKMWFKKADDLLAQSKKQVDEKKIDKDVVENLNQAWRWYVEAGSAAVRASMMD